MSGGHCNPFYGSTSIIFSIGSADLSSLSGIHAKTLTLALTWSCSPPLLPDSLVICIEFFFLDKCFHSCIHVPWQAKHREVMDWREKSAGYYNRQSPKVMFHSFFVLIWSHLTGGLPRWCGRTLCHCLLSIDPDDTCLWIIFFSLSLQSLSTSWLVLLSVCHPSLSLQPSTHKPVHLPIHCRTRFDPTYKHRPCHISSVYAASWASSIFCWIP